MAGYIIEGSLSGGCDCDCSFVSELALPVVERFKRDIIAPAPVLLGNAGLTVVAFLNDPPPVFPADLA